MSCFCSEFVRGTSSSCVTMCKMRSLRALVKQRLSSVMEEIFVLFESTIAEYEAELEHRRRLLQDAEKPVTQIRRADDPHVLVVKQEASSEQQEQTIGQDQVDQVDAEARHIKEEQEELWDTQERGEQLQGRKEADITDFPLNATPVKPEGDGEKTQGSQQKQTEENGEGSLAQHLEPVSSDFETECSNDECKERREPQTAKTFVNHSDVSIIVETCDCSFGTKTYGCSECGKKFSQKGTLQRHIRVHTGEKPFGCSVCGRKFSRKHHLQEHAMIHTGERPFSCTICGKRFRYKGCMRKHVRTHEESKPRVDTCEKLLNQSETVLKEDKAVCEKEFQNRAAMKKHVRRQKGKTPHSYSGCRKSFHHL